MSQVGALGRQHHLYAQLAIAAEAALAHQALDLALRGYAHLLEETAQ